jgi:hypothetical protein
VLLRGKLDNEGTLHLEWIVNKVPGAHQKDIIMGLLAGSHIDSPPGQGLNDAFGSTCTGTKRCWTVRRQGSDLLVRARLFMFSEVDDDFTRLLTDYSLVFASCATGGGPA